MTQIFRKLLPLGAMLLAILALVNSPVLHAQAVSIASVTGRISDSSGAMLPGAHIKMTAVDTGIVHETTADRFRVL